MYESLTHFQRSAFSLVFIVLVLIWVHGRLNRLNEGLIFTYTSNLKLHEPFPVKKNEKNEKKIFKIFGPLPGTPGVPHISAPRPKFQKPLSYPTKNPLKGYHAKFQSIRLSSFLWRGPGYEKVTWHFLL